MNRLFKDSEVFTKERPKKISKEQEENFYRKLAEEIIENNWSKSHIDSVINDLKELSIGIESGYEMAKKLESYYMQGKYKIDSCFIEFLEDLEYEKNLILKMNIKDWVKAHNPKAIFSIGDCLLVNETLFFDMRKDSIIYIVGIDKEQANYFVHQNKDSTSGYVLPYELVESNCIVISKEKND